MKTKIRKKVMPVLLPLAILICLIPAAVFAASSTTVTINEVPLQDGIPMTCGEGTATFDAGSNTLTLENVTISEGANLKNFYVISASNSDLTIELIGTNRISTSTKRPLYAGNLALSIKGTSRNDQLIINTTETAIQVDQGNISIENCKVKIDSTSLEDGIYTDGTLDIKRADVEVNSDGRVFGGKDINISENSNVTAMSNTETFPIYAVSNLYIGKSTVTVEATSETEFATITAGGSITIVDSPKVKVSSAGTGNTVYAGAAIAIDNSDVTVNGTSEKAFPALYAAGDITITNASTIEAASKGMRGIVTDGNMTIRNSSVTATGSTHEGMVVTGTLTADHATLAASGNQSPDAMISAIAAKNVHTIASDLTANGGIRLVDRKDPDNLDISFSITPAEGKLLDFKVDDTNWDGSAAVHFKEGEQSPYDAKVEFNADELSQIGAYRYVRIGEHIHAGGRADCASLAACADCGTPYGETDPNNHVSVNKVDANPATGTENGNIAYWYCSACGQYFADETLTEAITLEDTVLAATGETGSSNPDGTGNNLQTGDHIHPVLWFMLMGIGAAGLCVLLCLQKRRRSAETSK